MGSNRAGGSGGYRAALAHDGLRRALLAYALGACAVGISAVVVAVELFERSGSPAWATVGTLVAVLPFVSLSWLTGALADRTSHLGMLRLAVLAQAPLGLLVAAVATRSPLLVIATVGFAVHAVWTVSYPALAAHVPEVVDADELATSNALLATVDTLAWIVGPGVGGVVTTVAGPGPAAVVGSALALLGGVLALGARRTAPTAIRTDPAAHVGGGVRAGLRAIRSSRSTLVATVLLVASNVLTGLVRVALLVGATDILGMGEGGYGVLTAAGAAGGLLALAVLPAASRAGRPRLALGLAFALAGLPLVLVAAGPATPLALVLLAVAGLAEVLADVLILTRLQRTVPAGTLASVFGILDSVLVGSLFLGTLVASPLISLASASWALVAIGSLAVASAAILVPLLPTRPDAGAVDLAELGPLVTLLAELPMLRHASPTSVEAMAAGAATEEVVAGTAVVVQGEPADDFYAVESGSLEVLVAHSDGTVERVRELGPGSGFGELGLLRRSARTATVRALTDCRLVRVPGATFLASVGPGISTGGVGPGAATLDYVMAR